MADDYEVWREVWRVTERRDGAVYRTEFIEKRWVPMDAYGDGGDLLYIALSTTDPDNDIMPRRRNDG